jgi:hypothetical protein
MDQMNMFWDTFLILTVDSRVLCQCHRR